MSQTACGNARARFLCNALVAAALGAFLVDAPPRLAAQQTSRPAPVRGLQPANAQQPTPAPLYRGTLVLEPMDADYSFWAPDVVRDDRGGFHVFVSYVPGAASTRHNWGGDRPYIVYFTHPYTEDAPERNGVSPLSNRHTGIQAAELEVRDGRLICDRNKPFRIRLTPPAK